MTYDDHLYEDDEVTHSNECWCWDVWPDDAE